MRILHVFDHSLPLQSGYVSRSLSIIRGQRSRGWETIHVTTPRHLVAKASIETIDGLTFYRSPKVGKFPPVVRESMEMRATKRTLDDIVRTHKPDLLHAHSPVLNSLPALRVARKYGLPVVYEVRALWEDAAVDLGHTSFQSLRYRASRALDTYTLSRVDKVVALCKPLREEIIARGIAGNRVTVVPNAVDASFLRPPAPPDKSLLQSLGIEGQTVLGFVGSFYAYEGLDLLLEAVPILNHLEPNFVILLVGGGPEEARLRSMVDQAGIGRFVRFTGRVHHEEVPRYYGIIDICVFPRRQIRLTDLVTPLKPLEAMARVKPIVASDVGGHRELITDSETGYLFRAGDVTALATLLGAVISNRADAARIAAQGRRHVEVNHNWDAVVERYVAVYDELLSKKRIN
jgi:glycogen(starch) synthase